MLTSYMSFGNTSPNKVQCAVDLCSSQCVWEKENKVRLDIAVCMKLLFTEGIFKDFLADLIMDIWCFFQLLSLVTGCGSM